MYEIQFSHGESMERYHTRILRDVEYLFREKERKEKEAVKKLWSKVFREIDAIIWALRRYNEGLAKYLGYDTIDIREVESELRNIVDGLVDDARKTARKATWFWLTEVYVKRLLQTARLADTTDEEIKKMCTISNRFNEDCWKRRINERDKARTKLKKIMKKGKHIEKINTKIEKYLVAFEQALTQMRRKVMEQIDNTFWYFILKAMRSKKVIKRFDEMVPFLDLELDGYALLWYGIRTVFSEEIDENDEPDILHPILLYKEGKITFEDLLFRTPLKIDIKVKTDGIITNHSLGFKYAEITLTDLYYHVDTETKKKLDIIRHFAPELYHKKFHIVKFPFRYVILAKKLVYVVKMDKKQVWEKREETDKKKIVAMLEAFNKGKLDTNRIRPVYIKLENGERIYPTVYKYDKGKKVRFYIPIKRIFTHTEGTLEIYIKAKYPLLDYCKKLEMEGKQCSILSKENELSVKIPLIKITVKFHGTHPFIHPYFKKYWRLLRCKIKRGEIQYDEESKQRILELTEKWLRDYGQRNSIAVEIAVDGKKLRNPDESYILKIKRELRKLNPKIKLPRNHTVKYWWILPLHTPETDIEFGNQRFTLVPDAELKKIKRIMRKARAIGKTVKPEYKLINNGKEIEVKYMLMWHGRPLNHVIRVIRSIPDRVKVYLVNDEYNVWMFEGNSILEIISRHHQEYKRVLILTKPNKRLVIKHMNPNLDVKAKQILLQAVW